MDKARDLLGKNLKRLRSEKQWTQDDLAETCDLSVKMIQKIEYGKTSPSLDTIDKLAKALSTSPGELFRGSQETAAFTPAADFLATFADLSPKLQKVVQALVYRDPTLVREFPELKRVLK